MSLGSVGATLWIVFVAADLGCLAAGIVSGQLIRRGMSPVMARLCVIWGTAFVLAFRFVVPLTPSVAGTLAWTSLFACCTMMFMTSCVTLRLNLLP